MSQRRLRVMLVDDHEVVRSGLKSMLQAQPDISVVAEAGSVTDAVQQAAVVRPDVVVMDVRLTDGSGIEATREIRAERPETKVLMLTSFANKEAFACRAGVNPAYAEHAPALSQSVSLAVAYHQLAPWRRQPVVPQAARRVDAANYETHSVQSRPSGSQRLQLMSGRIGSPASKASW